MRTWKLFAIVALAFIGCTKENTNTTGPNTQEFNKTYTLQGKVMSATDGTPIGGGDLQLFLIQGTSIRSADRLNRDANDPLLGEYAFANIPLDFNADNKVYKVVAIKSGYQRFEAEISHQAVLDNYVIDGVNNDHIDTIYNYIGNIYLFPLSAVAPAYSFEVQYNGKPVPNATVLLDPSVTDNNTTFNQNHALGATNGYLASLSATTDATGKVTFASTGLALGGAYEVEVLPVAFTDTAGNTVQLARYKASNNIVVGLSNVSQLISLTDLTPTDNPVYIESISNAPQFQKNSTGTLTIKFNAPVRLSGGSTRFAATLTNAGAAVLNGTQPVSAALSSDGLTLTLTPNFTTSPTAADLGVTITYSDGTALVSPSSYPARTFGVFANLKLKDGSTPSGQVVINTSIP